MIETVVTLLIGGIVAATGYYISNNLEHKRWLRRERLAVYIKAATTHDRLGKLMEEAADVYAAFDKAIAKYRKDYPEFEPDAESDRTESALKEERHQNRRIADKALDDIEEDLGKVEPLLALMDEELRDLNDAATEMQFLAPESVANSFQKVMAASGATRAARQDPKAFTKASAAMQATWNEFLVECQKDLKTTK